MCDLAVAWPPRPSTHPPSAGPRRRPRYPGPRSCARPARTCPTGRPPAPAWRTRRRRRGPVWWPPGGAALAPAGRCRGSPAVAGFTVPLTRGGPPEATARVSCGVIPSRSRWRPRPAAGVQRPHHHRPGDGEARAPASVGRGGRRRRLSWPGHGELLDLDRGGGQRGPVELGESPGQCGWVPGRRSASRSRLSAAGVPCSWAITGRIAGRR